MQLNCPSCDTQIAAENINIQQMAAVCPACATIFQFELAEPKIKRRKAKPPGDLYINESDTRLHIAFRTNFRLDKNEAFLSSAIMSIVFTFVSFLLAGEFLAGDVTLWVPLIFGLSTLFLYYWLALILYNKTHIVLGDEDIQVSRQPLPNPLEQTTTMSLTGISTVNYEETPTSKKEGFDTPRFRVWANMIDGRHKMIVNDVIEEYALFITQSLNAHLETDPDTSRLVDAEREPANHNRLDSETPHAHKDNHLSSDIGK